MSKSICPVTPLHEDISSITIPSVKPENDQIVFIKVDELDEKPRLIRRLNDPSPRRLLHICDNVGCSVIDKEMKSCGGCKYNRYCSSECHKEDWWNHKDVCAHTCIGCKKIFKDFAKIEKITYNGRKWNWNFCKDCELDRKI